MVERCEWCDCADKPEEDARAREIEEAREMDIDDARGVVAIPIDRPNPDDARVTSYAGESGGAAGLLHVSEEDEVAHAMSPLSADSSPSLG